MKINKYLILFLTATLIILLPYIIYASFLAAAVNIDNPYEDVYTMLAYDTTIDPSEIEEINENGLDTNVQVDDADTKFMVADDRVIALIPLLSAYDDVDVSFYADYSPEQEGFPIMSGYGSYFYAPDNADIELGNDFCLIIDCYINIEENSRILYKADSFQIEQVEDTISITISTAEVPIQLEQDIPNGSGEHEIKFFVDNCSHGGSPPLGEDFTTGGHTTFRLQIDDNIDIVGFELYTTDNDIGLIDTSEDIIYNDNGKGMPYVNSIKAGGSPYTYSEIEVANSDYPEQTLEITGMMTTRFNGLLFDMYSFSIYKVFDRLYMVTNYDGESDVDNFPITENEEHYIKIYVDGTNPLERVLNVWVDGTDEDHLVCDSGNVIPAPGSPAFTEIFRSDLNVILNGVEIQEGDNIEDPEFDYTNDIFYYELSSIVLEDTIPDIDENQDAYFVWDEDNPEELDIDPPVYPDESEGDIPIRYSIIPLIAVSCIAVFVLAAIYGGLSFAIMLLIALAIIIGLAFLHPIYLGLNGFTTI